MIDAPSTPFDYSEAFSRNIGWLTEWEQELLRAKRVAIAGMGGVGGAHLLSLARLGIGNYTIADFDRFGLANFNRQVGASMDTLDEPKAEVMARQARAINPECDIRIFSEGVTGDNIDDFLSGVDLFVDGFDFFVLDMRAKVFARCRELGIPAITAAPIGMGAAYLIFTPDSMRFDDYFNFSRLSEEERHVAMVVGLAPKNYHRGYLVDPMRVDFAEHRVPSTGMACLVCAGIVGVEAIKLLLQRGKVYAAPWYHNLDIYTGRWHRGRMASGNRNLLQRIKLLVGARMFRKIAVNKPPPAYVEAQSPVMRIIDAGRWAPSGDNSQPWRFEAIGDTGFTIRLRDQGDHDIYDYDNGRPTLISTGALLTNMEIAAGQEALGLQWSYRRTGEHEHQVDVSLAPSEAAQSPLFHFIRLRSVDRKPYKFQKLTSAQKDRLQAAAGPDWTIVWHEGYSARKAHARLNGMATDVRLRLPECYEVHQRILDWEHRFSADKVPVTTLGLDWMTRQLLRRTMKSWPRQQAINSLWGSTLWAKWQMDAWPGISSAAHFSLVPVVASASGVLAEGQAISAGMALQRFWLTAALLGLAVQPCMAAVIFAAYGRGEGSFTVERRQETRARFLAQAMTDVYAGQAEQVVFRGRIGVPHSRFTDSRSTRKSLDDLIAD